MSEPIEPVTVPAETTSFDVLLDRWSKVATIVISLLGLVLTTYVTVLVVLPGYDRDELSQCHARKYGALEIIRESPEVWISSFAQDIATLCDDLDYDESYTFLTEFRVDSEIASEARQTASGNQEASENALQGFVSLGRADDYQTSNFRVLETGEKALKFPDKLVPGTVLIARWSVNLRTNSSNTEQGNNPIITVIPDEGCVSLVTVPQLLRGSMWVGTKTIECPRE